MSGTGKNQKTNLVQDLLNKPMDRKAFIKYTGAAIVGVAGLGGLTRVLQNKSNKVSQGYGTSAYGGKKNS